MDIVGRSGRRPATPTRSARACRTSTRRGCPASTRSPATCAGDVAAFPAERVWVNPDCGLKTRGYPETLASLTNLVNATKKSPQRM